MRKKLTKCDDCKVEVESKQIKKIGKIRRCPSCYRLARLSRRDFAKSMIQERKPIIKKDRKTRIPKINQQENKFLFNNLVKQGISVEEANKRIKNLKGYEDKIIKDIKKEVKEKKTISQRFKEAFKKLR